MIFGIGTDIVEVERIQSSLDQFGDAFAKRILAGSEWEDYQASQLKARFLAKRFAAKEAFAKAIGLGMRHPMGWQACEVISNDLGRPSVQLHGELAAWFQTQGWQAHLSLSDEAHHALAFVVIERCSTFQP